MTSKRLLRMFGIRSAKIVFALSLLISCLTFGEGNPGAQLTALKGRPPEQQLATLHAWSRRGDLNPDLAKKVQEIDAQLVAWSRRPGGGMPKAWLKHQMQDCVDMLTLEQAVASAPASVKDSVAIAREIKRSPIYSDPGPKQTTNWLTNAFQRLNNVHFGCNCDRPVTVSAPGAGGGAFFLYVIYAVLIIALGAFIIFAVSRFSWNKRLQRKAKALLDEDEPERTLDEWLDMADKLEREGRYREAVRCLYLACLLKIDEARIARFERSQTNWEHLSRIEASPILPPTLHFREPTKAFDHIWYGMRVNGSEDVARFRAWYRDVLQAIRPREAA